MASATLRHIPTQRTDPYIIGYQIGLQQCGTSRLSSVRQYVAATGLAMTAVIRSSNIEVNTKERNVSSATPRRLVCSQRRPHESLQCIIEMSSNTRILRKVAVAGFIIPSRFTVPRDTSGAHYGHPIFGKVVFDQRRT